MSATATSVPNMPSIPPGMNYTTFLHSLGTGCYEHAIDGIEPPYGYWPSLAAGGVFCALFAIGVIGHTVQFVRMLRWSSGLMAVGAVTELIGWAGRTWSAKCPYNSNAFLMQITTLIIAPTFFSAALYVLLGIMIKMLGRKSSILSANMYAIVFCTCDVISLVIQAVGGAMASIAADKDDGDTKPGTHIMVAGIAFQMGTMTLFAGFVVDFIFRVRKMHLERNVILTLASMGVVFLMVYVRSIYRTIELAEGWSGYLITHEGYFIGLDAAIMFVAVLMFLILDPATLLPRTKQLHAYSQQKSVNGEENGAELKPVDDAESQRV